MRFILTIALMIGSMMMVKAQGGSGEKRGVASFYHPKFEGRKTATGETFQNKGYTCASNTVKLGTYVKITNTGNGQVVYVKVNDRMAPSNHRLVDLTMAAAESLRFKNAGTATVKLEIVNEVEGRSGVLAQRSSGSTTAKNTL